jgi:hypothetical protein
MINKTWIFAIIALFLCIFTASAQETVAEPNFLKPGEGASHITLRMFHDPNAYLRYTFTGKTSGRVYSESLGNWADMQSEEYSLTPNVMIKVLANAGDTEVSISTPVPTKAASQPEVRQENTTSFVKSQPAQNSSEVNSVHPTIDPRTWPFKKGDVAMFCIIFVVGLAALQEGIRATWQEARTWSFVQGYLPQEKLSNQDLIKLGTLKALPYNPTFSYIPLGATLGAKAGPVTISKDTYRERAEKTIAKIKGFASFFEDIKVTTKTNSAIIDIRMDNEAGAELFIAMLDSRLPTDHTLWCDDIIKTANGIILSITVPLNEAEADYQRNQSENPAKLQLVAAHA